VIGADNGERAKGLSGSENVPNPGLSTRGLAMGVRIELLQLGSQLLTSIAGGQAFRARQ
jgi:hypothetical protein